VKGTGDYLPPEIYNAKLKKPNIIKQDVWAIGINAYELCAFKHPFNRETYGA
jgi:serine/threonine protein kinase